MDLNEEEVNAHEKEGINSSDVGENTPKGGTTATTHQ